MGTNMTSKKSQKKVIRARAAKTGESYSVARRKTVSSIDETAKEDARKDAIHSIEGHRATGPAIKECTCDHELGSNGCPDCSNFEQCDNPHGLCVLRKGHSGDHEEPDGTRWNIGQTITDAGAFELLSCGHRVINPELVKSKEDLEKLRVFCGAEDAHEAMKMVEKDRAYHETHRCLKYDALKSTKKAATLEGFGNLMAAYARGVSSEMGDLQAKNILSVQKTIGDLTAPTSRQVCLGCGLELVDGACPKDCPAGSAIQAPIDMEALKHLRFNPRANGDQTNFFEQGLDRMPCGHLVMDVDSPRAKAARKALVEFHGPDAVRELKVASERERAWHRSLVCLKPGAELTPETVIDMSALAAEITADLRASMSQPHSTKDLCGKCGQRDFGQQGEYPCSVCGVPTVWDREYEVGNRPLPEIPGTDSSKQASVLKPLFMSPEELAKVPGGVSYMDKDFVVVKMEQLPCGHTLRENTEIPQDLRALWGQAGIDGWNRILAGEREKHLTGRCSEAVTDLHLVPRYNRTPGYEGPPMTMVLTDGAGKRLFPESGVFEEMPELDAPVKTIDIDTIKGSLHHRYSRTLVEEKRKQPSLGKALTEAAIEQSKVGAPLREVLIQSARRSLAEAEDQGNKKRDPVSFVDHDLALANLANVTKERDALKAKLDAALGHNKAIGPFPSPLGEQVKVTINGRDSFLPVNSTYEAIVKLAGMTGRPSMVYRAKGWPGGVLHPGQALEVLPGMIFNVCHTGGA
jgi:ribosomal protein L37E